MGSSTSKSFDPESAAMPAGRRSYSRNVFQTPCILPASGSPDSSDIDDDEDIDEQVPDHRAKQNGTEANRPNTTTSKSKTKMYLNKSIKTKRSDKRACVPSESQIGEWGESSSRSSSNPSSRFLSRFSFFPGNISSRSSRAYPESSSSSIISNDDELQSTRLDKRNKTRLGCEIFPSCFIPKSPEPQGGESDNSDTSSIHELGIDNINNNNGPEMEVSGNRHFDRRNEAREPVEQSVRFSRTLSVGRLRERVLHRQTFPELLSFPYQSERVVVSSSEVNETGSHLSNENAIISTVSSTYSPSTVPNLYGNQDFEVENMRARETGYSDLLEHRSNFLERRRRIRSQVRALQRMGSRFENMSGHERSCVLSGQHRTGQCTCRLNNRDPNDGTNARGSISRIVLLAEALFEVLDEIHQQSVVLSSQPSLSSIGSTPAPVEVVEALPVKLYRKLPKHLNEEDAQCYICLVEYEDGDEVRVLPCHHEFHRLCINKWLKEVHRICPLCRGDVCKSGSVPAESLHL